MLVEDMEYLFENTGQIVEVNDIEQTVIITNAPFSEHEERHVHSLERISRGDIITIDEVSFLAISESITKRYGKYKVIVRHTNAVIDIQGEPTLIDTGERDMFDRPIYEQIPGELFHVPSIIESRKVSVPESAAIRIPDNYLEVTMQDNEQNVNLTELNSKINLAKKEWTVVNQDFSKQGLLILTCE